MPEMTPETLEKVRELNQMTECARRPTWEDLRPLCEAIGSQSCPGLESMRVVSGFLDRAFLGEACAGRDLMRPIFNPSRRYWRGDVYGWTWRKAGEATDSDRHRWPCWDGIGDGDQVTHGHIYFLVLGGWLTVAEYAPPVSGAEGGRR